MRILHLMSCRGWSSDAYWAGRIVRELQERGHDVTFVARAGTEAKVLSRLHDLGVRHLRTLRFAGWRSPLATARELLTLREWIGEHDVVHVHRGREHWLAAMAGLRARRPVPLFRTRHIVLPVRNHPPNRWLYATTAHVITVSHAIRDHYVDSGLLSTGRMTALPGGVDHRRFRPDLEAGPFRLAHGLKPGERVVGVLGGLRVNKGHRVFLESARVLHDRYPQIRFVLVGDGPAGESIRRHIVELGLEKTVLVVGFVREPELAVAAFDVAVYPSLSSEGMGRVVFEYMAAGRPIVATRIGLAAEVLRDGETAWLVAADDPGALAAAIDGALTQPARGRQQSQACRRLVETSYSGAVVTGAIERLYVQSLDRAAAGRGLREDRDSPAPLRPP